MVPAIQVPGRATRQPHYRTMPARRARLAKARAHSMNLPLGKQAAVYIPTGTETQISASLLG